MSDIIVIGGGIAGISAAARLSEGAAVTVLEAEPALGYHASGRSAALFEPRYGAAPVRALNEASAQYHHTANGGYLSPRGLMLLGRAGDDGAFVSDMAELNCAEISLVEARETLPVLGDQVTRAAYHAGAYDIDTDRMIQDFARQVRASGGEIICGAKVQSITYEASAWRVSSTARELTAPLLVNAAGAWADEIAIMAGVTPLKIVPYRRSMARVPAPEGYDISGWPMFFGVGESWYAKPDAGKLLISPADETPCTAHDAWAEDLVLAEGIDRYEQHVTSAVTRLETSWAGLRSFTPDRVLALGRDPDQPAFIWCAGQGGYGFQTAPAASRLVADLVLGQAVELDPDVVKALSPGRFFRAHT